IAQMRARRIALNARRWRLCQQRVEQPYRGCFVQRFVAVAALRRLHARRAAVLASTCRNRVTGGGEPNGRGFVSPFGKTRATGMAVVDDDGQTSGVGVPSGGDAANVPAIARREKR